VVAGIPATCYSGGAKAPWQRAWSKTLKGRRVAILPDADRPGLARAERDATQLSRVCADLRVVALPGLTVREDHGPDVSDWLDQGHDVAELKRLVSAAPAWTPAAASPRGAIRASDVESPLPMLESDRLPSTWAPMDIAAILAGDLSPLEPTLLHRVDGIPLLYPGRVSMFVGEPESCKSWAAQLAARQAIAAGGVVLYVDFEAEARDVVGHLLALGTNPDLLTEQLLYVRPEESFDEAGRTALLAAVARRRPGYVVLDGVSSAMVAEGLEPNSNKEFLQWFTKLVSPLRACTEGPMVLVDHVSKDKEHRGDWAVGAGQKKARVDGAMLAFDLVQPFGRGKTGVISILLFKDRPGYLRGRTVNGKEIARLELVSDPETEQVAAQLLLPAAGSVPDRDEKWRPTGLMERISQLLDRSDEPLSTGAIDRAVHGKATYIRQALDGLVEGGFAERVEGPRKASLYRSVNLFTATTTRSRSWEEVGTGEDELPFEEADEPADPRPIPLSREGVGTGQTNTNGRSQADPFPTHSPTAGTGHPGLTEGAVSPPVRSTHSHPPEGGGMAQGGGPVAPPGARLEVGCPACGCLFFAPDPAGPDYRRCTKCAVVYLPTSTTSEGAPK
jgi:hypothetical protein